MDLDAIPLGLYDHEVRLLLKVEEMFHLPNLLYVSSWGKIIHNSSTKDCPWG